MTFNELLEKMRDANDAGHGDKEAGFRLSTWLMIMETIGELLENSNLTQEEITAARQELENVKQEVAKTDAEVEAANAKLAEEAGKLMF